jgi:hypothetical protein
MIIDFIIRAVRKNSKADFAYKIGNQAHTKKIFRRKGKKGLTEGKGLWYSEQAVPGAGLGSPRGARKKARRARKKD